MSTFARVIGGAGTGKTSHLLRILDKVLATGVADPYTVGFVSFTRAARREAASRAGDRYNIRTESLEQDGWFKTLHSVCYRQLGIGDALLTDNKESREWLQDAVNEEISGLQTDEADPYAGSTPAETALAIWSHARSRLMDLERAWRRSYTCDERTPSREFTFDVVERYEQAKRLDGRYDFTDLLGRFAGFRFETMGVSEIEPIGDVPPVDVWFVDECQDNSGLSHAVVRRLTENSRWAYFSGDPFQSIYGFSGSDPSHFMHQEISKEKILDKSYRCPSAILDLGEQILRDCSDYWDRGIQPRGQGGVIDSVDYRSPWPDDVDPSQSWLLVARTNFQARRLGTRLNTAGVPWVPTRGNSKWSPSKKTSAIKALMALRDGYPITGREWQCVLKHVPSRAGGSELLERGTKAAWAKLEGKDNELADLDVIGPWGGKTAFVDTVRSGRFVELVEHAPEYVAAVDRWGHKAVDNPSVLVGTAHSVKGMEADNVLILTTTSHQVTQSMEADREGFNAERRLAYVAVTRTRERLIVANEHGKQHRMEIC